MLRSIFLCVFVAGCCGAHGWSRSDVALEGTFALASAVDGMESGKFVDTCHESNPVIGACGERVPLGVYIPLSIVVHAAIAYAIPHGTYRTAFLGLTTGAELDTIYANTLVHTGH